MIISRTPFRISLFGGGTDYPIWFKEHGGAVLGFTIDKYCYLSVRYLPPYFPHKTRVVYSIEEWVNYHKDIKHPAVRECLRFMDVRDGVEISHQSDLLARKGLGTSSAFTVGLLNALSELTYRGLNKEELAKTAIFIEQERIKESVGCQDQYHCAMGGLNYFYFNPDGTVDTKPIKPTVWFSDYFMLFDTGTSRIASEVAAKQIKATPDKEQELILMKGYANIGAELINKGFMEDVGLLLHDSWQLKRSLTDAISTPTIDAIYETAIKAGATGGKLLGAGGGGYMLFFAEPDRHKDIKQALYGLRYIPFEFEESGTQIIFNDEQV